MSLGKKILAIVLSVVLVVIGCGAVYIFGIRASIAGDALDESNLSTANLPKGTVNYAVFGVDARAGVDGDRSDTIMIVSINYKSGKVVTTSVQRDTMARIPESKKNDVSYEKINAAYSYGGPQLAIKTLNENFDLNITDYVTIGFDSMVDMVNALGGIDITINDERILRYTNILIDESVPDHSQDLKLGKNHLNGIQALSYARNRHSDDDFGRTQRQREVFRKIFKKLSKADTLTLIDLVTKIYPYVKTSMTVNEMSSFAQGYMKMDNKRITEFRVPMDNYYENAMIGGAAYLVPKTLRDNAIQLHQAIYGKNVDYTPSATLNEISDAIVNRTGIGTLSTASSDGTSSTGTSGTAAQNSYGSATTGNVSAGSTSSAGSANGSSAYGRSAAGQ